jgi:hypothetical protein
MRYRKMTPSGDYQFGAGSSFLVDSPEAVAQAIRTRMALFTTEWFLDKREGLNRDNILGYGTQTTRDREVQARILGTPGARSLLSYSSSMSGRAFSVSAQVDTVYGVVTINVNEAIR